MFYVKFLKDKFLNLKNKKLERYNREGKEEGYIKILI